MKNPSKKPWPTKDAMVQIYEKNLWGGEQAEFYSGLGSHHPDVVNSYLGVVTHFLQSFDTPPVVCDLGCGDFNVGKELVAFSSTYKAIDIVPELITRNKKTFQHDKLEFYTLDIATDELPPGDCAILRQVLQHLSNDEINKIVEKLYNYTYILLTEHLPEGDFEPNAAIISGQGIRLKKQSGVNLLAAPFNFKVKEEQELLSIKSPDFNGRLVTRLYVV